MAADQERNRKIAEALGFKQIHDESIYNGWWEIPGGGLTRDLPDFSKPEWQIKIQERVRELWSGPEVFMSYEYCRFPPRIHRIYLWTEDTNPKLVVSGGSSQVVWEDALLWLAERKVKHESNG